MQSITLIVFADQHRPKKHKESDRYPRYKGAPILYLLVSLTSPPYFLS